MGGAGSRGRRVDGRAAASGKTSAPLGEESRSGPGRWALLLPAIFKTVCGAGLDGLAISSGQTEMDEEIDLLRKTDAPRVVLGIDVAVWEMESEAWSRDLKRKLGVIHCERRYAAPSWKHERKQLRVV